MFAMKIMKYIGIFQLQLFKVCVVECIMSLNASYI